MHTDFLRYLYILFKICLKILLIFLEVSSVIFKWKLIA